MESKFYTPKITEFHVGFEYEQHEIINERDPHWKMMVKKMVFSKKEINQMFYNVDLIENLNQGRIRVKYLDEEDIRELNFILLSWNDRHNRYRLGGYNSGVFDELLQYPGIFEIIIDKNNPAHIKIEEAIFDNNQMSYKWGNFLFDGVIKNKSELKKLLIQLGIINE